LKFYGYSACSTCRKALAWLAGHGLSVDPIDITSEPPSLE
jgi:arsenate reductase